MNKNCLGFVDAAQMNPQSGDCRNGQLSETLNKLRLIVFGDGQIASRPIVWLLGFFAFLNVYAMQAVLPTVMHEFQATPVQAGYTVGATVLGIALMSPFMGMLSDAWGRKPIIVISMFALTLPTALIGLADSLTLIVLLRFLQGLAVPGIVVVLVAYLSEEFRSGGLARLTTTYVAGTVMGGFSGRFISGHMGDWLGWRAAFVTLALLNLMGAVVVLWYLPASRKFEAHSNFSGAMQVLLKHLSNPRLLAICAVGFCVLFTMVGTFTYLNFYLAAPPFSLSSGGLGNVFLVYLVGALVTPFAGSVIARHGFLPSMLGGLACSASGLALTLVPSLPVILLGLTLCSCGVFVCQSATIGRIADRVTEGRSLATGLYYMSYYAGGACGSWITGLAFERYAWSGAVLSVALFQLFAGLVAVRYLRAGNAAG
jgi:YNFM family putative membrane transporter